MQLRGLARALTVGAILGTALGVGVAGAQAPAGAPAGANGICKDGTYSMQAQKEGACRGHKGVQTWYGAATSRPAGPGSVAAAPAPASGVTPSPAPAVQTAPPPPAPAGAAATASPAKKRLSPAAAAAAKTAAPGGGAGLVWVNTESNVYHCNGDPFYGKTKAGKYMTEDAAKAAGARGERGKSCVGK